MTVKQNEELSKDKFNLLKQDQLVMHRYLEHILTEIQDNNEKYDNKLLLPYSKGLSE